ncbi:MAG: energy-coupling factor transporter transmembrane component T [Bacillota bacterium]
MSLIEYYPGDTFFHRLDPRVKIALLIIMTLVIFAVKNFLVIGLIFATVIVLWSSAKLPLYKFKTYFKFLFSLFVILIILQSLFYGGNTILVKPVIPDAVPLIGGSGKVTMEGLVFGFLISLRLLTLVALLPLISMTTPVHLLALGLVRLGMSHKIAYTATTTINLIPTLQAETRTIMDAQKLRGFTTFEDGKWWQKMKAYPTLVVPLVIGAMRGAQLMGVAMDARAFGTSKERTYIETIKMNTADWVTLALITVYAVAALILNFVVL